MRLAGFLLLLIGLLSVNSATAADACPSGEINNFLKRERDSEAFETCTKQTALDKARQFTDEFVKKLDQLRPAYERLFPESYGSASGSENENPRFHTDLSTLLSILAELDAVESDIDMAEAPLGRFETLGQRFLNVMAERPDESLERGETETLCKGQTNWEGLSLWRRRLPDCRAPTADGG